MSKSKLTKWAKEPLLEDLKADLEAAKPFHNSHMSRIREWRDLKNITGSAKPRTIEGRSTVQPKLVRRQAEWRYSALTEPFLSSDKLFSVNPVTFEDKAAAEQNEILLNWQFRSKINKVKFIDNYVRSAVDDGTVIVRLGWELNTEKVMEEVPVWSYYPIEDPYELEQMQQMVQQALMLREENPRGYDEEVPEEIKATIDFFEETQQLMFARQTGISEEEIEKIIENKPTIDIVNPANIVIDPSCNGDISKALFAVVKFEANLADLKKSGINYKNLDLINWESAADSVSDADFVTSTPDDFKFKDKARKKVIVYEYWGYWDTEGNGKLTPIVASWIGDTLIRLEQNPFPDGKLPFVVATYMPVVQELYGEPDAELLGDNQRIIGAVTRGMIDLMGRSANGQQGFAKGMLDAVNRRRFEQGLDYEFNADRPPSQSLIEHKFPEIPASAMHMLNLQNAEAEALTGVKAFHGGLSGSAYGEVATGIKGMLDAASKREMAILRRLAEGIKEIGIKLISMNSEFLSEEEVVRVTNEKFITIRREDLKGNFDLIVDISTTEIDERKSQDLGFMLQTMGNTLPPEVTMKILAEIAKLKRMPELSKMLERWEPPQDPIQDEFRQRMMELELAEKEAQIELIRAEAAAKASVSVKNNVEVEEQLSGADHAKKMAQQKAQSQGLQNLQVTKALTDAGEIQAAIGYNRLTEEM